MEIGIHTSRSVTTREEPSRNGTGAGGRAEDEAAPSVVVSERAALAVRKDELGSAIASIREAAQSLRRDLSFSLDEDSGAVVVKVVDSDGELIRQIPSEEILRLREQLEEARSLLLDTKV